MLEAVPTYGFVCYCCTSPKADAEIIPEVKQHQHHGSANKLHARTGSGLLYISLPVIELFFSLSQLNSALDGDSCSTPAPRQRGADKEGGGWVQLHRDASLQAPLSPLQDTAGGLVTLSSEGGSSTLLPRRWSALCKAKRTSSPFCKLSQRGWARKTQLCLVAVLCFLIPSPSLALSISQPYDTTGGTLSQFCWKTALH